MGADLTITFADSNVCERRKNAEKHATTYINWATVLSLKS